MRMVTLRAWAFLFFIVPSLFCYGEDSGPLQRLFGQANALYGQGQLQDAATLYLRVLLLDPGHTDAHCNYASLLIDVGKTAVAEEHYRKALELDDKHAGALFNLALLLQDQGLEGKREAAILYEQLLETEPDDFDALTNLATTQHALGDLASSVKLYEKAVASYGSSPHAEAGDRAPLGAVLEHLGRALLRLHDTTQDSALHARAVTALKAAIDVDPGNALAAHMLAAASTEMGGAEGESVGVAPEGYVTKLFDDFSSSFDSELASLGYRAPTLIADRLGDVKVWRVIIDLGCGTGLLPPALGISSRSGGGAVLVGVDLSAGMLGVAEEKGLYDALYQAEVVSFLRLFGAHRSAGCAAPPVPDQDVRRKFSGSIVKTLLSQEEGGTLDVHFPVVPGPHCSGPVLFAAADVLVYFGALEDFSSALAKAMRPQDLAIFTVEEQEGPGDAEDRGWRLTRSGRYVHSRLYLQKLFSSQSLGVSIEPIVARQELGKDVKGLLVVVSREQFGPA